MSSEALEVTNDSFTNEVLQSDMTVLVDFWAAWCAPCIAIAPHLDTLAQEYQGKLKVVKVNVDANMQISQQFEISSIPTLIIFKNGEVVDRRTGASGGVPALRTLVSPHIS